MKHRRLQHAADNLCQMFCGWRLDGSKPIIARLGSGRLEIDALTGECRFNGQAVPQLPIAGELVAWLSEDLERYRIPVTAIVRARVTAELELSQIPWSDRSTNDQWFTDGRAVRARTLWRCEIRCRSEVATDEQIYQSASHDREEWPPGWLTDG